MDVKDEIKLLREENLRLKNLLEIQEYKNVEKNTIEELVDIKKLEDIFNKFSNLTGYTTGFIVQDTRKVLISTGWKDICKIYHRGSDSSAYICEQSNAELTKNLKESHQICMKECQHGMVDGATPIIIDGQHLADIFSGQVLFHKPNIEDFKLGANKFGYDIKSYLNALEDVKIISKEKLREVLEFLSAIAKMVAEIGKEKKEYLKLNASLEQKVKERMREKESLLSLFDDSNNVLFKWRENNQQEAIFVSKSIKKLLGYTKKELEENKVQYLSCIDMQDIETFQQTLEKASNDNKKFFSHKPYRIRTKDGSIKWILDNTVIVKDENNNIIHYLSYLSDITQIKEYQKKLEVLSKTDQLTKTKNRLYIDEMLQQQYYRFLRDKEECSVILVDIDYFKQVNDTYGHMAGDIALVEFADILKKNTRKSDIVGRWGGEEFLIILPHTNAVKAKKLANKLRKLINSFNFTKIGNKTASFGVAEFENDVNIEQLLEKADKALYISKENGRNQVN